MSRFTTLLRREWLQHHRGWLVLTVLPPLLVLALLLAPFGQVEAGPLGALELMLIVMLAVPAVVLAVAASALLFQLPGLARRDRQDRSIEFWLSLPTSHSASIGATVLAHTLLVPLAALAVGAAFSLLIGLAAVAKAFGAAAAFDLPWGTLIAVGSVAFLRAALGVLLASLWLLPLVLLLMAASAWLKRWGVPVLVIGLAAAQAVLARLYGITVIDDTTHALLLNAGRALVHDAPRRAGGYGSGMAQRWLAEAPQWLAWDGLAALRDLAQPLFAFALLTSAAAFGLLVLRRRNG